MASMAEVGCQGLNDFLLVVDDERDGAVDPVDAAFGARRTLTDVRGLLSVENSPNGGRDRRRIGFVGRLLRQAH